MGRSATGWIALGWLLMPSAGPVGCSNEDDGSEQPALTYYRDVKPILDAHCTECHQEGGIAPFSLTTFEAAADYRTWIKEETSSRRMPPWHASDTCGPTYAGDPTLDDDTIATLAGWADLDAPEGDPADEPAPPDAGPDGLSRVDLTVQLPVEYTPNRAEPDDFRCFLVPWPEEESSYITGFRGNPGNPKIVHHVIAFYAPPDSVADFQEREDADPEPGYTCYGAPAGPNDRSTQWLGAWAPGSIGGDYPAGTGLPVEPGSLIILQVHYSLANDDGRPDRTSIELKIDHTVEHEAIMMQWANPAWFGDAMRIPAGEPDVAHRFAADPSIFTGGRPLVIHSAGPHMHTRGTSARLAIERAGGSEDCLIDVPSWDFHWQRLYQLDQSILFNPGDRLSIECHWDNSAGKQPLVDGEATPPRDLFWGEGTNDEMCLGLLYVSEP